jgi:hypothetical protein
MPKRGSAIISLCVLASACASIPDETERSTALAAEAITTDYKIAVTSVMKKPEVGSFIGGAIPLSGIGAIFNVGTAVSEGGAAKHTAGLPLLEKIDDAMIATLNAEFKAAPEVLPRESYGGDELASPISNIAFDAFSKAKELGYDAMFFVHVQPALASATGGGKRRLSLTGTPVFKSTRTNALMFFKDYRIECANYKPLADEELGAAMAECADTLIASMIDGLKMATAGRAGAM